MIGLNGIQSHAFLFISKFLVHKIFCHKYFARENKLVYFSIDETNCNVFSTIGIEKFFEEKNWHI